MSDDGVLQMPKHVASNKIIKICIKLIENTNEFTWTIKCKWLLCTKKLYLQMQVQLFILIILCIWLMHGSWNILKHINLAVSYGLHFLSAGHECKSKGDQVCMLWTYATTLSQTPPGHLVTL
jgi:hypothetical protein